MNSPYQTQCAGLSIVQYDDKKMMDELPEGLALVEHANYIHITPVQTQQAYSSFIIKRV